MNYSRYWDLHLCSSTFTADKKKDPRCDFFSSPGPNGKTEYRYDFLDDMRKQADYRESKREGYDRQNARVLDKSELIDSQESFLQLTPQGGISEELSRLRYVSCLVSIEHLKDGHTYPQLRSLVQWIADNRTINKLRINCHGGGHSLKGFCMGEELSPAELVQALVRHGLSIAPAKTVQDLTGLAHAARWKRDNEVNECEKCQKPFKVFLRRHHCRRCGGIFCETCSSWKVDLHVALAGENNKTVDNVKNARVCQKCYEDAMGGLAAQAGGRAAERPLQGKETIYGLKQITLALCMGAQSEHGHSNELGRTEPQLIAPGAFDGFIAGSLACRLLEALRTHQLLGIKVSASNLPVSGETGEIINCELKIIYPTDTFFLGDLTHNKKDFKKQSTFDFPAKIWGSSMNLKSLWDARKRNSQKTLPISSDITVGSDKRRLYFGLSDTENAYNWLQDKFFKQWAFRYWQQKKTTIFSATSPTAPGILTMALIPPPRVTGVEVKNHKNQLRVFLTGKPGLGTFKDFKSFGVS